MNQEEKTHWTQDKILLYVKACMSATGLTRMPSRSELSEYYGNDKLTNAIRRFPGGYYKIAEILNVEMKKSETQFGKYGEDLATKLLEEHGFAVERMSTRYAYDLYVNGSVTQAIQPYEYGHPYSKKTLLWERGVPPLHPTNIVEPTATWCPSGSYSHKHGEQHKGMFTTDRARNRAKTFPGVAKAMSEQWG